MVSSQVKGCPWCGSAPKHEVKKHHNAGEPVFSVTLRCSGCGVQMSTLATDDEHTEAGNLNQQRYKEKQPPLSHADLVAHVVVKGRLLTRWNTRADDNEFCTDYYCAGDCGLNGHGWQHK